MEQKKLEKEIIATVKRLADSYFEDMQCHPQDYAEWLNTSDEDECWESAIEKAKEDVRSEPKKWIDEDFQEEMTQEDFDKVWDITEEITWETYYNQEVESCFE